MLLVSQVGIQPHASFQAVQRQSNDTKHITNAGLIQFETKEPDTIQNRGTQTIEGHQLDEKLMVKASEESAVACLPLVLEKEKGSHPT